MGKGVAIHFFWKPQKFLLPQNHPKIPPPYHILRRWRRGRCHFLRGDQPPRPLSPPTAPNLPTAN